MHREGRSARCSPVFLGEAYQDIVNIAKARIEENAKKKRATLREISGYAPPMVWGPEITVASHIGSVTFSISYEAVGDTLVQAKVTYFKGEDGGQEVTEQFQDSTVITTSNSVATVRCKFKGVPTGSAVRINCEP